MNGFRLVLCCVTSAVVLSACGGGEGSSAAGAVSASQSPSAPVSSGGGSGTPPVSTTTPPSQTTTNPPTTGNPAPKIIGSPPATATVGQAYRFTPSATDSNNDSLVFAIQNKPEWASFDSTNGALTGIPQASDAGTYSNITISVTDGTTTTSLAAFKLTVNQAASGMATLSWTPPTANTDGSALTTLAGYHVYYGTSPDNLDHKLDISNAGVATYVVDNLSDATWYFAMTSYTGSGLESGMSDVGSKTVN